MPPELITLGSRTGKGVCSHSGEQGAKFFALVAHRRSSVQNFPVQCTEKDVFYSLRTHTVLKDPRGSKNSQISYPGYLLSYCELYKPCRGAFQVSKTIQITNKLFVPDSIMSVNNLLLPTNKQRAAYLYSKHPKCY